MNVAKVSQLCLQLDADAPQLLDDEEAALPPKLESKGADFITDWILLHITTRLKLNLKKTPAYSASQCQLRFLQAHP